MPFFPACEVRFPALPQASKATFFLAAEEYVAQTWPADSYLFSWILPPTVVMGRNQVAHQELNLDYCHAQDIDIVRRKSGGGAIFADHRNIMWSLIVPGGDVEPVFRAYAFSMAEALKSLGAPVEVSGRNDILLENASKVCGNAFYHLPDRNIVHGTMLYDTNMEAMTHALRPDPDKLQSKGVQSVRRRIGLLKDYIAGGTEQLRQLLTAKLTDRALQLTMEDVAAIQNLEEEYLQQDFRMGHIRSRDEVLRRRIEGCGMLELHFDVKGSVVKGIDLRGDFFELADAHTAFQDAFLGQLFTASSLQEAAQRTRLHQTIRGLSAEALHEMLGQL